MLRLFLTLTTILFVSFSIAQDANIETSIHSSGLSSNEVIFTVGDIHIDDNSGTLGIHAFQLFYEGTVNVESLVNTEVKIFPNPTSNYASIVTDEEVKSIRLIDLTGKEIFKTTKHEDISLQGLDSGNYIILVNDIKAIKVTKQ